MDPFFARVAQLEGESQRAPSYGLGGWEFKPLRGYHIEGVCLCAPVAELADALVLETSLRVGVRVTPGVPMSEWWNGIHNGLKIRRFGMRVQVPPQTPSVSHCVQSNRFAQNEIRLSECKSIGRHPDLESGSCRFESGHSDQFMWGLWCNG